MTEKNIIIKRICIFGIVQGVGFRPFVSRLARQLGIRGSVANRGSYVEVFAQGRDEQINQFADRIKRDAPPRSAILKIRIQDLKKALEYPDFQIIESEKEEGQIFVSPDIATCNECRRELYDPSNRRYMHPFINCTACGPRVTILDGMPYDRERTSMKEFPMCPSCSSEYHSPKSRRYDAQPVCCNDCGPEVYLVGREERGREAITYTRKAIMAGKIAAIKGIGGFHLCCDAKNEEAVARLRKLKKRPAKPFAVMMKDFETVTANCSVPEAAMEILTGPQKPILLLEKKEGYSLAPSVAPDNPKIGVMLPYAPVQMLLFDYNDHVDFTADALVMTSGNVSGAPICRTDEDAIKEIGGFCDLILSHNRKIRLRCDDSVMDFYKGRPYMIRRSRGYAPLPVMSEEDLAGQVLGIGGELKNTFTLAKDQLYYPSPYVGDMEDLRTVMALKESIGRMEELLEITPDLVICDLHPKYNTTVVASDLGISVKQVQHHFAHILSCMAENDYHDPVIGISFDGTGYGTDKSIWGGEFLLCDPLDFKRCGSIRPFMQIGGDTSAREGWRIALSMINSLYEDEEAAAISGFLDLSDEKNRKLYKTMAARGLNCVRSTSAGRLFDAVSAILQIRKVSTFEGEASGALMFRAMEAEEAEKNSAVNALKEDPSLTDLVTEGDFFYLPTDRLIKFIIQEKEKGSRSMQESAWLFHAALAAEIAEGIRYLKKKTGIHTAAFSGGVFQNTLLLSLVEEELKNDDLKILRHHFHPPNDGGISLGQAFYGMHFLRAGDKESR